MCKFRGTELVAPKRLRSSSEQLDTIETLRVIKRVIVSAR